MRLIKFAAILCGLAVVLTGACSGSISGSPDAGVRPDGCDGSDPSDAADAWDGRDASDGSDATVDADVGPVEEMFHVTPEYYDGALRNPLKGITTRGVYAHEWATLAHVYIRWNEIEDDESDGIDKIISVCNQKFSGVAERNVKVIPRVYLHWDGSSTYWPADLTTGDYSSERFKQRLVRLIRRLGEVWNHDPRVAFVEMGIFGKWGEQESPSAQEVDAQYGTDMEQTAGDEFTNAFPDKIVSVRHIWDQFPDHSFGEYWDSWAHNDQIKSHGVGIRSVIESEKIHQTHYIGGEVAYDWGHSSIQPGDDPDDTVQDPEHREFMINTIRWLHCTQLRWIDDYDQQNPSSQAGAEEIQRALGYRFVVEDVGFTPSVTAGRLRVSLSVKNEGSAPFYYRWPVEVSLLDLETREPVWSATFQDADIRSWLPGQDWTEPEWTTSGDAKVIAGWSRSPLRWGTPPATHTLDETFSVSLADGTYILALAVLDPAGMLPSLRFATRQYFRHGRHPIGLVAVGAGRGGALPPDMVFDDPKTDDSLHYIP
ncbi:MAG: DUF4832 domain-containing protein [Myxococcales bacterium]|nr:DUF4832 domain-containing protein [Myxococcales bacterium]